MAPVTPKVPGREGSGSIRPLTIEEKKLREAVYILNAS